jgi:hypothetical protein
MVKYCGARASWKHGEMSGQQRQPGLVILSKLVDIGQNKEILWNFQIANCSFQIAKC